MVSHHGNPTLTEDLGSESRIIGHSGITPPQPARHRRETAGGAAVNRLRW